MERHIIPFAVVTLLPVALLAFGTLFAAQWLWAALIYMTLLAFVLDRVGLPTRGDIDTPAARRAADRLCVTLALAHFALLGLAVYAIGGNADLSAGQRVLAFFAFGLFFGQVSNSNAHELIHRPGKLLHWVGAWVFITHLFGHHASAHRFVHHRYVGTPDDPNSAPRGQSFYRFATKAWGGSFMSGLKAVNDIRSHGSSGPHPYFIYVFGAILSISLAWLIAGTGGVVAYVLLASYATTQLLLSDYVQHYGLRRRVDKAGNPEPVGPQHSWDSPHPFSSLLMLNAPRHSDHHAHPGRRYPALVLPDGSPVLPYSLPIMGLIAWSPRHWRRLIHPRLAQLALEHPA